MGEGGGFTQILSAGISSSKEGVCWLSNVFSWWSRNLLASFKIYLLLFFVFFFNLENIFVSHLRMTEVQLVWTPNFEQGTAGAVGSLWQASGSFSRCDLANPGLCCSCFANAELSICPESSALHVRGPWQRGCGKSSHSSWRYPQGPRGCQCWRDAGGRLLP